MNASWWGRHRAVLLIASAVLVAIGALSVLTARSSPHGGDLDPQNPAPEGAQAVARVLTAQGVDVAVVRRIAQLQRTPVNADTTVLVTSPRNLTRSATLNLEARARNAGSVVLADPGAAVVAALELPVRVVAAGPPGSTGGSTGAGCTDPLLSGLRLDVPASSVYRGRGRSVTSCFPAGGAAPGSRVLRVDRLPATYVIGAVGLFTNDRVDRADNAAAALRLLGQHDRLVWYVPDLHDVAPGDTDSLAAQLPGGLVPALWLLAASVLATMLWRGRRLGALVVEPLPVAVKAVESTRGRGRLYRRVSDRPHAAAMLRDATARRLAVRLRLPAATDVERLAAAVGEATGTRPEDVVGLLVTRPVEDDRALTRLAADLTALEEEVHRA